MTVLDLAQTESATVPVQTDVCIVGAGAAGLYLASRLAASGLAVVVLEAGGPVCLEAEALDFLPDFAASIYPGATTGRAFGLGGSTARWGGVLVPHSRCDLRAEAADAAVWQHLVSTVESHSPAVLRHLGLSKGGDFWGFPAKHLGKTAQALESAGLAVQTSQLMPMTRRHYGYLLKGLKRPPTIYLHAVCNRWLSDGAGRISEVGAAASNGKTLSVQAKAFVIAAGAIESTRILLELEQMEGNPVDNQADALGRYLSDHLSCPIATMETRDMDLAANLFGMRFSGPSLRPFRFMEASPPPLAPRGFAHFIFEMDNPAYQVAKETLAALQGRRLPKLSLGQMTAGAAGLTAFAYRRFLQSRLHIPKGTEARWQLDIEQVPNPNNRITLSAERDQYGRPKARLDWRVSKLDLTNIQQTADRMLQAWPGRSAGLPGLKPLLVLGTAPSPYDAYHPTGTCRMGTVVDFDLKVQGADNLTVLSTAVLPSAGSANPTFSMLCLGEALAGRLIQSLKS